MIEGLLINGLFVGTAEEVKPPADFAEAMVVTRSMSKTTEDSTDVQEDNLKLWHDRLAHINKRTICKMVKLGSVEGLHGCQDKIDQKTSDKLIIDCDACCLGKQTHLHFPLSTRQR